MNIRLFAAATVACLLAGCGGRKSPGSGEVSNVFFVPGTGYNGQTGLFGALSTRSASQDGSTDTILDTQGDRTVEIDIPKASVVEGAVLDIATTAGLHVDYIEGGTTPASRWSATSGQVTVVLVSATSIRVKVKDANLEAKAPPPANSATGSVTISGDVSAGFD